MTGDEMNESSVNADVDPRARAMFEDFIAGHAHPRGLGCGAVAHRDLGFCAACVRPRRTEHNPCFGASTEIAAWRLLAMAERGSVDWTKPGVLT